MDRLTKAYSDNKRAFVIGAGIVGSAASIYFARRMMFRQAASPIHRWHDAHFKSENLALYSTEA